MVMSQIVPYVTLKIGIFVEGSGLVRSLSHLNNFFWGQFPENIQLGHKILSKLCKFLRFWQK